MDHKINEQGLYDQRFEHDACGIGFVAHVKGRKSQQIISDAITILENLDHRGACGAEINTGDGAGIMIQIPHEFLYDECLKIGFSLNKSGDYGVGMLFLPKDIKAREECRSVIYRAAEKLGLEVLGFRKVQTNTDGHWRNGTYLLNRKWSRYLLPGLMPLQPEQILNVNYTYLKTT